MDEVEEEFDETTQLRPRPSAPAKLEDRIATCHLTCDGLPALFVSWAFEYEVLQSFCVFGPAP
jgi:hypothetical protein